MMSQIAIAQQEFLRNAMTKLGMTRDEFADRIGTNRRRLDNWLLPSDSNGFREMDEMAWKFIREILQHEAKDLNMLNEYIK
jgi:aspartate carbamoyltransferase catalytic subunit